MAGLPRDQDHLSAMMGLMRDEVSHHVAEIERKVAPHITFRRQPVSNFVGV